MISKIVYAHTCIVVQIYIDKGFTFSYLYALKLKKQNNVEKQRNLQRGGTQKQFVGWQKKQNNSDWKVFPRFERIFKSLDGICFT